MKNNGAQISGLEIVFNKNQLLTCFSAKSAGVSIHLFTTPKNLLVMGVSVKEPARERRYVLRGILPGDKLTFRFLQGVQIKQTIRGLKHFSRNVHNYRLKKGTHLGLDVWTKEGEKWRITHPINGGFSFMLGNVPRDHARTFVMAGNETKYWHWQLSDLYANEQIRLRVVETRWCDKPHYVRRK